MRVRAVTWSLWAALVLAGAMAGRAGATVTNALTFMIDASKPGPAIPANFLGLSVSSWSIDGDNGYTKCFTTANTQMVNLFRQIGIKHLRTIMGNATADDPDPSNAEIDAFFDFAAAAGVNKIIWSLHLDNAEVATNWANNKAVAAHIWATTTASGTVESNLLDSFAFDNEPDWLRYICCTDSNITGYATPASSGGYIGEWRTWQQAIAAVASGARFSGPDTGSKWPCPGEVNTSVNGTPFTRQFASDEAAILATASQHIYGQTGISNYTALQLAEACLSSNWLTTNYTTINNSIVGSLTMPYRFTECSPFDNEQNPGNQCFATALWAVDFYHWFAQRGCAGVDPFTRTAQYNAPIYYDGTNYVAEAVAYGMKAFGLGAGGNVIYPGQYVISNPGNANITGYGVVGASDLYVTVVNKTFNEVGAVAAAISIPAPPGFSARSARYMVLAGGATPGSTGNATQTGANLGGAEIPNDGAAWAGAWIPLAVSNGGVSLTVMPTTAVVIDLQNYRVTLQAPSINTNGIISFTVAGPAGNYSIQNSADLSNWTQTEAVSNSSGTVNIILGNSSISNSANYYRAALMP
jgi:hypothetical protein